MKLPFSHLNNPQALLFFAEESHKAPSDGVTGHTGWQVRESRARIGLGLADARSVPAEPVGIRVGPIVVESSACRALTFLFEPSKAFLGVGQWARWSGLCFVFFCSVRAGRSWGGRELYLDPLTRYHGSSRGCDTSARDCNGHNTGRLKRK